MGDMKRVSNGTTKDGPGSIYTTVFDLQGTYDPERWGAMFARRNVEESKPRSVQTGSISEDGTTLTVIHGDSVSIEELREHYDAEFELINGIY